MLRRKRTDDLDGYIFDNKEHARVWLAQPFVPRLDIALLEVVEVGEFQTCPHCRGAGALQSIKVIGKTTLAEFMDVRSPPLSD